MFINFTNCRWSIMYPTNSPFVLRPPWLGWCWHSRWCDVNLWTVCHVILLFFHIFCCAHSRSRPSHAVTDVLSWHINHAKSFHMWQWTSSQAALLPIVARCKACIFTVNQYIINKFKKYTHTPRGKIISWLFWATLIDEQIID